MTSKYRRRETDGVGELQVCFSHIGHVCIQDKKMVKIICVLLFVVFILKILIKKIDTNIFSILFFPVRFLVHPVHSFS